MYCSGAPSGGDCIWWNLDRSGGNGPFFFQNGNTNNYSFNLLTSFTLAQNTWYHIVCIDDYSNLNKIVYINGSLNNTTSFIVAHNGSFKMLLGLGLVLVLEHLMEQHINHQEDIWRTFASIIVCLHQQKSHLFTISSLKLVLINMLIRY